MTTVSDIALSLRISDQTILRLIQHGRITGVERTLTGRYRLPDDAAQQIVRLYEQPERVHGGSTIAE